MKFSIKKTVAMALILLNVLTLLSGCVPTRNDNMSDKQRFIKQMKQSFGNDDSIEITAAPFAQHASLSAVFSLDVEISEDNIYVGGNLYDKVEYVRNPEIAISDFDSANKDVTDEECLEIIEKIKNGKSCYILETESAQVESKKIAVYVIDDAYYFLSFMQNSEEQVGRIRYVKVK